MDHKTTTKDILVKLRKDHIFTDPQKAEVLMQILDDLPEEEAKTIQKTIR